MSEKVIIKKHWLYGKLEFKVDVSVEDECHKCIHWPVCNRDMESFCLNFNFGTTQGQIGSCDRCIHRFTRWDKDRMPCFKCQYFEPLVKTEKERGKNEQGV